MNTPAHRALLIFGIVMLQLPPFIECCDDRAPVGGVGWGKAAPAAVESVSKLLTANQWLVMPN